MTDDVTHCWKRTVASNRYQCLVAPVIRNVIVNRILPRIYGAIEIINYLFLLLLLLFSRSLEIWWTFLKWRCRSWDTFSCTWDYCEEFSRLESIFEISIIELSLTIKTSINLECKSVKRGTHVQYNVNRSLFHVGILTPYRTASLVYGIHSKQYTYIKYIRGPSYLRRWFQWLADINNFYHRVIKIGCEQ